MKVYANRSADGREFEIEVNDFDYVEEAARLLRDRGVSRTPEEYYFVLETDPRPHLDVKMVTPHKGEGCHSDMLINVEVPNDKWSTEACVYIDLPDDECPDRDCAHCIHQ